MLFNRTKQNLAVGSLAILIGLGAMYCAGCTDSGDGRANAQSEAIRVMPVNTGRVHFIDGAMLSRTFTGTVISRNRSDLGFEQPGKIIEVFVDDGDTVTQGQPLAQLDIETLAARRSAVNAQIEQAITVLAELQSGPRQQTIRASQANRDAAKSQLEMAKANFKRRMELRDQGGISSEEFDQAQFGFQTAQANYQAAEEQLAELEAGTRYEKIDAQKSLIKQLEAALEEVDVAISKSTLHAPFDGMITQRYLDPGNIVASSTPVVRLVDQANLEATIGLPYSIASTLSIGSQHTIEVEGRDILATLTAKIRELDPQTRTQSVILQIVPEDAPRVLSGQLCELQISSQSDASGFWIPTTALSKGIRGLWSVLALVPDRDGFRVEKRDVQIMHTESNRVLVRGTLEDGDQIVMEGVHRVAAGQLVKPANP